MLGKAGKQEMEIDGIAANSFSNYITINGLLTAKMAQHDNRQQEQSNDWHQMRQVQALLSVEKEWDVNI